MNMQWLEIDEIPEKIQKGIYSYEKATWLLLTELYTNARKFLGVTPDDDEKSEFIIFLQPKIKPLIDRYKPDSSPFSAFFYTYVSNTFISWKRRKLRENYNFSVVLANQEEFYAEQVDAYEKSESEKIFEVSDSAGAENSINQKYAQEFLAKKPEEHTCINRLWPGKTSKQKKLTVLALKNCFYIRDQQVAGISRFCGYPEEILHQKIDELCKKLEKKVAKRKAFIKKRDSSYFFHKKYAMILANMSSSAAFYQKILKKYNFHTAAWQNKRKALENNRLRICPTNKAIAEIVGMSERQVCNYVSSFKCSYKKHMLEKAD